MKKNAFDFVKIAHNVLQNETSALQHLDLLLDQEFVKACKLIEACSGRVVFTGIGHSGHVAAKAASSMSSLQIPSLFLHAAEAVHGELGVVTAGDVVILISNSGETQELLTILPRILEVGARTIAIVGNPHSLLAQHCEVVLHTGFKQEAGPFKFAGSTSTMLSMALCDALAMAVAAARGLTEREYAKNHPGGAVGGQLRMKTH